MAVIIVGDIHIKEKEPFLTAIKNFLYWINIEFPNDKIIFLGDEFDSSSPTWNNFALFSDFIKERNDTVYVLGGNHTYSRRKGSVLNGIEKIQNCINIDSPIVTKIDSLNCIFLPYLQVDNKYFYENEYEDNKKADYIFTHLTPKECAFGNEGIDFDKINLKGTFIHGHVHLQKDFSDKNGNQHIVLGVPIATRHLEEQQEHRIIKIEDNRTESIKVPQFFTYQTLEFGEFPKNKNNILNIKNVPSWEELYKVYENYYIRDEGVEFVKTENELQIENLEFESSSLKQKFKIFNLDRNLPKEIVDVCYQKIEEYETRNLGE